MATGGNIDEVLCCCLGCQNKASRLLPEIRNHEPGPYCESCAIHLSGHQTTHEENPCVKEESQLTSKAYFCKYGCGAEVVFSNNKVAKSGKKIPLNLDWSAHSCTNNPYFSFNMDREPRKIICRNCAETIIFDDSVTSTSGKKIPMNPDRSYHNCKAVDSA